jgi:hypothetical protein
MRTDIMHNGYAIAVKLTDGRVFDICTRCGGSGHYSFNLMDGTICSGCGGNGLGKETTEADAIKRATNRDKARARKQAKAEREFQIKRDAMDKWQNENADLIEALKPFATPFDSEGYVDFSFRSPNRFLTDMADQAINTIRPLSSKQTEAAQKALVSQAERDSARAIVNAQKAAQGHYGQAGEKVEAEVKITRIQSFDGQYGTSWLIVMETVDGYSLKAYCTGAFVSDAIDAEKTGETLSIKGTIKKLDEYNGVPQTVLTRVKTV